jgi:hypothetical protein
VRSRLRSDTNFVKVWLITLANASCSLCLFFLSKRYVCTWMHDLPSLSLIYIIWLQVSVILAYIAMVGSISSLWYNIFLFVKCLTYNRTFPLTFSFNQLRTDDLFWKAWEYSFIFSLLKKKLKAADGGKKIKEDFIVVSCMVGQTIVLTHALVSYKLIICHMLYKTSEYVCCIGSCIELAWQICLWGGSTIIKCLLIALLQYCKMYCIST